MKTKKIQLSELKIGMKIKTMDNDSVVFKTVTDVWDTIVEQDQQVRLEFTNGTVVNCSVNHPIMCLDEGNVIQKLPTELTEFDEIISENQVVYLYDIKVGQKNDNNYIDITVEDTHTFFTADTTDAAMILTHNSQGGVRNGAATVYFPVWHLEVEDMLVLKNNKGTEDNRVRHLDYGVQFNKLMYERLINNQDITLFSPSDVPGLYEAFFADQVKFKELYEKAERNTKIRKKTIAAVELFSQYMEERKNTGRIYLQNVDNANTHSSFIPELAPIRQSNLCVAADTQVDVLMNNEKYTIAIEDLAGPMLQYDDVSVLSYNIGTGEKEYKKIEAYAKTSPCAKVLEITNSVTGKTLVCTADHQVYTKNRGYVMAGELTESDKLLSAVNQNTEDAGVSSMLLIKELLDSQEVYDITVEGNHNFFANDILVHNCAEITLPTKPLNDINDPEGRIPLCTLSAINWGNIRTPADFERVCTLAVRGLDELLDYQNYPVLAAELSTKEHRPLGVGIINFAYWLAKNGLTYQDISSEGLALVDEWTEAWSYFLIKASADLAVEKGAVSNIHETKYGLGITPNQTYAPAVDELVPHVERQDWHTLRQQLKDTGIRNSTLMALMPSESSSQVANATNGIEPPRSLISIKQSKHGVLRQVVPEYKKLKNKYDMLWDQRSPEGYLKIVAVLQKYVDQGISVNTSYNPAYYPDEKIPMSTLLKHMLMFYKYGGKQLYYFQTNDGQGEVDTGNASDVNDDEDIDDSSCDSCTI